MFTTFGFVTDGLSRLHKMHPVYPCFYVQWHYHVLGMIVFDVHDARNRLLLRRNLLHRSSTHLERGGKIEYKTSIMFLW